MEDNLKDILTKNRIKHDIRDLCWYHLKTSFVVWAFSVLIGVMFFCFVIDMVEELDTMFYIIMSIILAGFLGTLILFICCIVNYFKYPKKYEVVKDAFLGYTVLWDFLHRYRAMKFSNNGIFVRNALRKYTWSERNNMDNRGLEQSSHIGDVFYLVVYKKKILNVYNTNLFELGEDL